MSLVKELNEKLSLIAVKELIEESNIDEEMEEMEGMDEGFKSAHRILVSSGWKPIIGSKGQETKAYENPAHPGHQIVNWKNKLHHVKGEQHIATIGHWSRENPVEALPKYLKKNFK